MECRRAAPLSRSAVRRANTTFVVCYGRSRSVSRRRTVTRLPARASAADFVTQLFHRLANLSTALAERFLGLARHFLGFSLVAELLVVFRVANRALDLSLQLFGLAAHFILVPHQMASMRTRLSEVHAACLGLRSG